MESRSKRKVEDEDKVIAKKPRVNSCDANATGIITNLDNDLVYVTSIPHIWETILKNLRHNDVLNLKSTCIALRDDEYIKRKHKIVVKINADVFYGLDSWNHLVNVLSYSNVDKLKVYGKKRHSAYYIGGMLKPAMRIRHLSTRLERLHLLVACLDKPLESLQVLQVDINRGSLDDWKLLLFLISDKEIDMNLEIWKTIPDYMIAKRNIFQNVSRLKIRLYSKNSLLLDSICDPSNYESYKNFLKTCVGFSSLTDLDFCDLQGWDKLFPLRPKHLREIFQNLDRIIVNCASQSERSFYNFSIANGYAFPARSILIKKSHILSPSHMKRQLFMNLHHCFKNFEEIISEDDSDNIRTYFHGSSDLKKIKSISFYQDMDNRYRNSHIGSDYFEYISQMKDLEHLEFAYCQEDIELRRDSEDLSTWSSLEKFSLHDDTVVIIPETYIRTLPNQKNMKTLLTPLSVQYINKIGPHFPSLVRLRVVMDVRSRENPDEIWDEFLRSCSKFFPKLQELQLYLKFQPSYQYESYRNSVFTYIQGKIYTHLSRNYNPKEIVRVLPDLKTVVIRLHLFTMHFGSNKKLILCKFPKKICDFGMVLSRQQIMQNLPL